MLDKKKATLYMSAVFIYLVLTSQLHYVPIANPTIDHWRHLLRGFLDMLPLIAWFWFVQTRVIQPSVRKYLIIESLAMQFSMFVIYLQTIIVTENVDLMALSVIGIFVPYFIFPVFSLMATLCLGMPEQFKLPKIYLLLPLTAIVLGVFAFTNYFHEWFFKFEILPDDINRSAVEPRWMCYFAVVFCVVVIVWRFVATKRFAQKNGSTKTFVLILGTFSLILFYHIPYIMKAFAMHWEFIGSTQFTFFIEILSWIICMSTGLVPVNTHYDTVFECSSMDFEIYDLKGRLISPIGRIGISSTTFDELRANGTALLDSNTVLHMSPLKKKGYVVWKKDISFINHLLDEQEQIKLQLKEQEVLLQNELTNANAREKIQQKKAIYAKIDNLVKNDIDHLDEQIKKLIGAEAFDKALYEDIIQRGIYIKRKSNLLILAESNSLTPLSELKLTLDEMMTGLYNIDKDAVYLVDLGKLVKTIDIIACLELLQRIVAENAPVSGHTTTALNVSSGRIIAATDCKFSAIHLRLEEDVAGVVFKVLYELSDGSKASDELRLNDNPKASNKPGLANGSGLADGSGPTNEKEVQP